MMNIYRISQNENNGYDTYDSAVVIAHNEEEARNIIPTFDINNFIDNNSIFKIDENQQKSERNELLNSPQFHSWTLPKFVKVEYIGKADERFTKPYQVCASFNAG